MLPNISVKNWFRIRGEKTEAIAIVYSDAIAHWKKLMNPKLVACG
jgi:hypothetical protein